MKMLGILLLFLVNQLGQSKLLSEASEVTEVAPSEEMAIPYIDPHAYYLGPGDKLLLVLKGKMNFLYTLYVNPNGFCILKFGSIHGTYSGYSWIDTVFVLGKSLYEVSQEIAHRVSRALPGVDVSVFLHRVRNIRVYVIGDVKHPGEYILTPLHRVSDAVNRATPRENASKANIKVLRKTSPNQEIKVDLLRYEETGDPNYNPFLKEGDVIIVPQAERWVKLWGEICTPRTYGAVTAPGQPSVKTMICELLPGDRISDILEREGGVTPWADLENAYILRGGHKINVDLRRIILYRDTVADMKLEHGDIIVIPSIPRKVCVIGEVKNPGSFDYITGSRAEYYIGLAGGFTPRADRGKIRVKRRNGEVLKYRPDLEVEPGDIIEVPRVLLKFWEDYVYLTATVIGMTATYFWIQEKFGQR